MVDWARETTDASPPRDSGTKGDAFNNARFDAWGPPDKKLEAKPKTIDSEANFDAAVKNVKGPVVVNFNMSGCVPCRDMNEKVNKLAKDFAGQATILNVDIEKNPKLAERFGVTTVPRVITLVDGKSVKDTTGTTPYDKLSSNLTDVLKKDEGKPKGKAENDKDGEKKLPEEPGNNKKDGTDKDSQSKKDEKAEKIGATEITSEAELTGKLKESKAPVLVNFNAPWCAPSADTKKGFNKLADDLKDNASLLSVNMDKNPWAAEKFGITGFPTTIAFVDGKPVDRKVGKASYEELRDMVAKSKK